MCSHCTHTDMYFNCYVSCDAKCSIKNPEVFLYVKTDSHIWGFYNRTTCPMFVQYKKNIWGKNTKWVQGLYMPQEIGVMCKTCLSWLWRRY